MRGLQYANVWAAGLALLACGTSAFPSYPVRDVEGCLARRDDKPFYLRIAPLGASITNGYLSTDDNGFRKYIRDQLRYEGWSVNMVGSEKTGTMDDNDNEGHPGWTTQQVIYTALPNIVPDQPNLVLINVGTNNAIQNSLVDSSADLYITLLDRIWEEIPQTTVILSTLLRNKDADTDTRALTINDAIRTTVVDHYAALCKPLVLADMADGFITQADLNDSTHPTDAGYKKMASVWWDAFQKADEAGYLQAPPAVGVSYSTINSTASCATVNDSDNGNYKIQLGSGTSDGLYVHSSEDKGLVWSSSFATSTNGSSLDHIFFANLVNEDGEDRYSAQDEIIYASYASGEWSWTFFLNDNLDFSTSATLDLGLDCAPGSARFADINADGLDDFLCISSSGDLEASLNTGGSTPVFEYAGTIGSGPDYWTSEGYTADRVLLADVDGDGRVDWCIQLVSGAIACRRNGGQGDLPTSADNGYWEDFSSGGSGWTTVFPSQNSSDGGSIQLVDINGDFKADWLSMDSAGQVETYVNNRGSGPGLLPNWTDVGVTYEGLSASNVTNAKSAVKFARIYGTGRRDYVWVQEAENAENDTTTLEVRVWQNQGAGGTTLKGDGTRYCDMNGDGQDDYVWVGPNGQINIYLNENDHPYWDNHEGAITLGVPRKNIHLADLDGDGLCDLLSVDNTTGAVHMWQNQYNTSSNKFSFTDLGQVTDNTTLCSQGYGTIENDLGVQFADLTGDGKADYLCIEPDGRITGYINNGLSSGELSLQSVGQIKSATYYDRQDIRFGDVNGDGRADLILVDKYSGNATVWYNNGLDTTVANLFVWTNIGVLYKGWDRGANMIFGTIGGQGRADMVQVVPWSNLAFVSYNQCPMDSGGDDSDMGDPDLPAYSSNTTLPSSSCA